MRLTNRFTRVLIAGALLVGAAAVSAITITPPPPREYVCQTWVALSSDDRYSMRLILKPDGTGLGVLMLYGKTPEQFKVNSWTYEDYSLALSVRFQNREVDITQIDGVFKRRVMSYISGMLTHPERLTADWLPGPLELSFHGGQTQFRFGAWPERDLQDTLDALKKATVQRGDA